MIRKGKKQKRNSDSFEKHDQKDSDVPKAKVLKTNSNNVTSNQKQNNNVQKNPTKVVDPASKLANKGKAKKV
jgi:hypothetical protein